MSEREIVDPADLVAPAGPDEAAPGVRVRTKADGVVRFSKRGQYVMIGVVAIVIVGLAYGLGIFETNRALQNGDLHAQPQVSASPSQAPEDAPNSTIDQLTRNAQSSLPARSAAGLPHSLAGQMVTPSPAPVVAAQVQAPPVVAPPNGGGYYVPQNVPNPGSAVGDLTQSASHLFQGGNSASDDPAKTQADARHSGIFVGNDNSGQQQSARMQQVAVDTPAPSSDKGPGDPTAAGQDERIKFANGDADRPPYLNGTQQNPVGKVELWAGSAIGAELDSGINTDLPGPVVAHVTRDVFDSKAGRVLVIPKGSRLIGRYNSRVTRGEARVQIVWDRLIWPDGKYLNLLEQTGTDTMGNAGAFADVNDHRGGIITATILSGLFGAALDLLHPTTTGVTVTSNGQVVGTDVGTMVAQTGQTMANQKMQQPPELTVPAGENFNVLLDRTIVLAPWEPSQ